MSLPTQSAPYYNAVIPSTNQAIRFRPFLVKEEKALLIAQQSEDSAVMLETLKEVIKNCIKDDVDVEKLAIFDYEYLFTQIRAKSIGEFVELQFTCAHCEEKDNTVAMNIDLTKIPLVKDENHTNKISLFDDVGVIMKYPTLSVLEKAENKTQDLDVIMDVVIDCIEIIYSDSEMFYTKEQSRKEVEEFVMNLTREQFDKLEQFFVSTPKFQQEIDFDCPKCGQHNHTILKGIQSFF